MAALSPSAQAVALDFMTVYTAELERHDMQGLPPVGHAWEIDLGEVTFLAAYVAAAGEVVKNSKLVPGHMTDFYGQSTGGGGGIGNTRDDFEALARGITAFESQPGKDPELVAAIEALTPLPDQAQSASVAGDIFRRVLLYMNCPEYEASVEANAQSLTTLVLSFLQRVRADQSAITAYLGVPGNLVSPP